MKTIPKTVPKASPRTKTHSSKPIPHEWAWHYRTLLALRDHLSGGSGDRARESCDAMEPPSLHPEDLADELYDRELAAALPADVTEAQREVDAAIERLKTGAYGICEVTGRDIPPAELRAKPWCRHAAGTEKAPPRKHS
jgi:RNA polymerase-binding transcription factor DksA